MSEPTTQEREIEAFEKWKRGWATAEDKTATLRDQFAMAALAGLWSTCVPGEPLDTKRCAALCYKQADAMMEASKK